MDISKMISSNYLVKEDLASPMRLTIERCFEKDISQDDKPADMRYVVEFKEAVKPLILNKTNIQAFARTTGEQDSDNWSGKQLVLYNDMSVEYQGKFGGVRVYQELDIAAAPPAAPAVPADEEIPF